MKNKSTFTISTEQSGERLDLFIVSQFSEYSRSWVQKSIERGEILINQKVVKKNYILKNGDEIKLVPVKVTKKTHKEFELDIIFECPDYIIVNKPSGWVVHSDRTHPVGSSLIDSIVNRFPDITSIGPDPKRPGIIHRLDKLVSGVMVIARTQEMFDHLGKQFRERTIIKQYQALVHGVVPEPNFFIDYSIERKKSGFMAAKTDKKSGREARTEVSLVTQYTHSSLISVHLVTGRTHQIRVHLFAYGHPIVGDPVYMSKKYKTTKLNSMLHRPFLHAFSLGFTDLNNHERVFTAPLPEELTLVLSTLKVTKKPNK